MAVEKGKHKTPLDGVSSEAYYLDDGWNDSPKAMASVVIIRELDKNGDLVNEIYGSP